MEDYGGTTSDTELDANLILLSIMDDHSPPSSPLLPRQEEQEDVEEDERVEENVALGVRNYMFEPLAPADDRLYYWLELLRSR